MRERKMVVGYCYVKYKKNPETDGYGRYRR